MKKILFTAVSALAIVGFAEDGVTSTEFGALYVPSMTKETIVGVPWLESGTGNTDVAVSNLVLTAGLNNDDTLMLYDSAQKKYTDSWILSGGVWEPDETTTAVTIKRGSALKLTRNGTITKGFYIMGKPTTDTGSLNMTLASAAGQKAYTLVAFPFAEDTSPNDSKLTWSDGINGQTDSLVLQLADGSTDTYGYKNSTKTWRKWDGSKWVDAPTITAGMGAWFITSATSGDKKVSW